MKNQTAIKNQIVDVITENGIQLQTEIVKTILECINWKPSKASEIALDRVMFALESTSVNQLLDDENNIDFITSIVHDMVNHIIKAIAPLVGTTAEELGVNC